MMIQGDAQFGHTQPGQQQQRHPGQRPQPGQCEPAGQRRRTQRRRLPPRRPRQYEPQRNAGRQRHRQPQRQMRAFGIQPAMPAGDQRLPRGLFLFDPSANHPRVPCALPATTLKPLIG